MHPTAGRMGALTAHIAPLVSGHHLAAQRRRQLSRLGHGGASSSGREAGRGGQQVLLTRRRGSGRPADQVGRRAGRRLAAAVIVDSTDLQVDRI